MLSRLPQSPPLPVVSPREVKHHLPIDMINGFGLLFLENNFSLAKFQSKMGKRRIISICISREKQETGRSSWEWRLYQSVWRAVTWPFAHSHHVPGSCGHSQIPNVPSFLFLWDFAQAETLAYGLVLPHPAYPLLYLVNCHSFSQFRKDDFHLPERAPYAKQWRRPRPPPVHTWPLHRCIGWDLCWVCMGAGHVCWPYWTVS